MVRPALLLAAVVMTTSPASAGPVFDRLSGQGACFARVYLADHLRRNPAQRVRRIQLRRDRTAPAAENTRARFTVAVGFRTVDAPDLFSTLAICTTRGAVADCLGEGDTGAFRLSLQGEALRVEVERLEVEGSGADLAASDDRVFLVPPAAPNQCQGF
jgi:hypothetical protein